MECYDIRECKEHGNKNGETLYELHFWCKCDPCNHRFKFTRGTRNEVTVTIKNKELIPEIVNNYKNISCGSLQQLKTQYANS